MTELGLFNILRLPINSIAGGRWFFGVYIHNHKNYNIAELGCDQFYRFSPLWYEVSNLIGINMPVYNLDSLNAGKATNNEDYNTSAYDFKNIFFVRGMQLTQG